MNITNANLMREFWKLVQKTEGCYHWLGVKDPKGRGLFTTPTGTTWAHNWIFYAQRGSLPASYYLKQRCGNPACVRCHSEHVSPERRGKAWRNQDVRTHSKGNFRRAKVSSPFDES